MLILITIVVEAVHLLVYHLHDLVLVEAVEVCGVPTDDTHLII